MGEVCGSEVDSEFGEEDAAPCAVRGSDGMAYGDGGDTVDVDAGGCAGGGFVSAGIVGR